MNFDSSACRSRDSQLLVTGIWPIFASLFVIKKPGINKLFGSLVEVTQWHITFDLKQVDLQVKNLHTGK